MKQLCCAVLGACTAILLTAAGCKTGRSTQASNVETPTVEAAQTGVPAGWEGSPPYPGFCTKAGDPNNDGEAEWSLNRGYDADGHVTAEVYDHGADGLFDSLFQYKYNESGKRTHKYKFTKAKRDPVQIVTYTYESGNQTRIEFDMDADQHAERIITQSFDDRGRRVRRTLDYGGDGNLDGIWTYTYEDDRLATERWDQNGDGDIEEVTHYEYDEKGHLIREMLDVGNDGKPEKTLRYHRDDKGRVIKRVIDDGADGRPDEVIHVEYTSEDLRSEVRVDSDADGNAESITYFEYDRHGQLIREKSDRDGDGSIDAVISYSYDCWQKS